MADEVNVFHWADYLVFVLMLLISAGIGIVFGWVNRKKKTTKDFLLGGGDLSVILEYFYINYHLILMDSIK